MSTKSESLDLKFSPAALKELVLALKENRLIIVVGSGLSMACGLPSWEKLVLELMPQWLENLDDKKNATTIRNLSDFLLNAADIWWNVAPTPDHRSDFIEKTFNPKDLKPHDNHTLLVKLPVRGYLTTNYDDLLEIAEPKLYQNRKTNLDPDLGRLFRRSGKFLLKLHGTWDNLDSIILTVAQYARHGLNQAYQTIYNSLQLNYQLLFLGYGGRDPDLEQMHQKLSAVYKGILPARYLLLNKPSDSLKASLKADHNCIIAEYDSDREQHTAVTNLLKYLYEQTVQPLMPQINQVNEKGILTDYLQYLQTKNRIRVFDQSFKLSDIYISLRLEPDPVLWNELGKVALRRELAHGPTLPRLKEIFQKEDCAVIDAMSEKQMKDITIEQIINKSNRSIILGDAGSGKTTLFHHLVHKYSTPDTEYIPILLTLREWLKNPAQGPIQAFCRLFAQNQWELDAGRIRELETALIKQWQNGKILLLLDGLDEMSEADLKTTCNWIEAVAGQGNKILVSCRRASYRALLDRRNWLLYSINPFNADDRLEFIYNYFQGQPEIAKRLSDLVEIRSGLRSLGQVPLLMGLICYIYEQSRQALPEKRVELYERCVEVLLLRREEQQFEAITDFKKKFLGHLAFYFFNHADQQRREVFTRAEVLVELLKITREKSELRSLLPVDRIDDFFEELVKKNSLLLAVGNEQLCFPHRSFQEYFAACYLDEQSDGFVQVTEKLYKDPYWTETICLYAGMQTNATRLVNALGNTLGKQGRLDLVLRLIPDTIRLDWDQLDKVTLNWKVRRSAVEQLVLPEPNPDRVEEIINILEGVLKADVNANVRYSALIALEKVGTPEAKRIVGATHIIPEYVLLEHKPYSDTIRGIKFQINQTAGRPPNMVLVPGGSCTMGETNKKVTVKPFYMSIFPVTNREFRQFVEASGYNAEKYWTKEGWKERNKEKWEIPRLWDHARFNQERQPVVGVSWYEAFAYCHWLTEAQKAKKPFRLPKEEEWEWAARGPKGNECAFGEWNEDIPRWDSWNDYDKGLTSGTSRVNSVYKENISDFGLSDLTGNVWEWTDSWYTEDKYRVIRGGSWDYNGHGNLRAAFRYYLDPRLRDNDVGFRYCQDSP